MIFISSRYIPYMGGFGLDGIHLQQDISHKYPIHGILGGWDWMVSSPVRIYPVKGRLGRMASSVVKNDQTDRPAP